VGRFSRSSAFSRTKRIDWSSSTIQIGFMCASSLPQARRFGFMATESAI
jgi:hypothetical protein